MDSSVHGVSTIRPGASGIQFDAVGSVPVERSCTAAGRRVDVERPGAAEREL